MAVVLILISLLVILMSFVYLNISKQKGLPPGPMSLPVLGSVWMLKKMSSGKPYLVFMEESKKYGNIMSFMIGRERIVVLIGYETIYEALVKQQDVFNDRPGHLPLFETMTRNGGGVAFQGYNHHWKISRRFTLQTLRDFGVGKTSIEQKILVEINAASKVLQETNGKPISITPLLQNIVGNITFGIVFDQRYEYDDPRFEMVQKFTGSFISGDGAISPINFFPGWIARLMSTKVDDADVGREKLAETINNFILDKIQEHEDSYDENNMRDFIDHYIRVSHDDDEGSADIFTKGNMLRIIQDLFVAGSETSSTTLEWAMLFMMEYPEIQQKCQLQIDEVLGHKPIDYADRGKLPYVEAVLMEIQRLGNITPHSLVHSTTKDTELLGYKIPARTLIIPLLYSISYDPKYWVDPEKFNPARFLDKGGCLLRNDAFVPFSVGPRACLGEPLAKMELFLVFSRLIQQFTFTRGEEGVVHSFEAKPFQMTRAPMPYKIKAVSR